MAKEKVHTHDVRAMLQDMAERIERGGLKSVTFKIMTDQGEQEHTFSLKTKEEQLAALVTIRKLLGQVH
jgi:hypothetical protein